MARVNGRAPSSKRPDVVSKNRQVKIEIPMDNGIVLSQGAAKRMVGRHTELKDAEGNRHKVKIVSAEAGLEGKSLIATVSVPSHVAEKLGL